MKIAVVGSRNAVINDLGEYLPKDCTEIVSGGAVGIDSCAAEYAKVNSLMLTELLPQYEKYGRAAPIVRNKQIVEYADSVIAFWNGSSKGTEFVIRYCNKIGKPCVIVNV